jgi:5-(hydroxymethyl)furfural/furfural oxidase
MAYLNADVRRRLNLKIEPRVQVRRLRMERDAVTGIEAIGPQGPRFFDAKETILCAGALQSPLILMRSGLGPAVTLENAGLRVEADIPGIGRNLQEHPTVAIAGFLKRAAVQPASLRPGISIMLRMTSKCGTRAPSDLCIGVPNKVAWHAFGRRVGALNVALNRPESRGEVRLERGAGGPVPIFDFNVLGDPVDLDRMRAGFREAYSIMKSAEVSPLVSASFVASFSPRVLRANRRSLWNGIQTSILTGVLDAAGPFKSEILNRIVAIGPDLDRVVADDSALSAWLRQSTTGWFHPAGTCRMGSAGDPLAVVDPCSARVYGTKGLRVIDASVIPQLPRANTNLTTMMIAERFSEAIGRDPMR